MTYCLLHVKKNSGKHSRHIIRRLIRLVIETNTLTALVALTGLVVFIVFPNDNFFVCPPYVLGKLYSNTLLVILNNRVIIRNLRYTYTTEAQEQTNARTGSNHQHHHSPVSDLGPYFSIEFLGSWSETETSSGMDSNAAGSCIHTGSQSQRSRPSMRMAHSAPEMNHRSVQVDRDVESGAGGLRAVEGGPTSATVQQNRSKPIRSLSLRGTTSHYNGTNTLLTIPRASLARTRSLNSGASRSECCCGVRREQAVSIFGSATLVSRGHEGGEQIVPTSMRGSARSGIMWTIE
jgi:hypothetical protein